MLMTNWKGLLWAGSVAAVTILVGCGRQQDPAANGGTDGADSSRSSPGTTTGSAAAQAGQNVAETAKKVVDEATAQAQALIDQTRGFLSEQNYAAAAGGLEKLTGMALTPEQEVLVEELKVEAGKLSQVADARLGELKTLVDEKKYQEASAKLTELANVSFTPQQQELYDRLKAEIQKGLSSQTIESGKKALGGLLQGN